MIDKLRSVGIGKLTRARFWLPVLGLMLVSALLPARAELVDIDNSTLQQLLDKGVTIVDVRRADEWTASGVIEGSELLTFFDSAGRYDAKKWLEELSGRVDTTKPVILICEVGGRTSVIGKWLGQQLETVYNVEDGIVRWIKDGNKTVAP